MLSRQDATGLAVRVSQAAGLPSAPVNAPDTEGGVNHVLVLGRGAERVVARVPIAGTADFERERWCMRAAAEVGVPVPDVLYCGSADGVPVMLQRFLRGTAATVLSLRQQWRLLGELARRIAAVPLPPDAPAGLYSASAATCPQPGGSTSPTTASRSGSGTR